MQEHAEGLRARRSYGARRVSVSARPSSPENRIGARRVSWRDPNLRGRGPPGRTARTGPARLPSNRCGDYISALRTGAGAFLSWTLW